MSKCGNTSLTLVDVYIKRLRRKLMDEGAPPCIETVRGVGYRLAA